MRLKCADMVSGRETLAKLRARVELAQGADLQRGDTSLA
jgi:hypothetical protein